VRRVVEGAINGIAGVNGADRVVHLGGRRVSAIVVGLHVTSEHSFSRAALDAVRMTAGVGVVGDAHAGATVQHRSRVAADPTQPNLRQVHLIHELDKEGFDIGPGSLGETLRPATSIRERSARTCPRCAAMCSARRGSLNRSTTAANTADSTARASMLLRPHPRIASGRSGRLTTADGRSCCVSTEVRV
jgi:hypothetical protein